MPLLLLLPRTHIIPQQVLFRAMIVVVLIPIIKYGNYRYDVTHILYNNINAIYDINTTECTLLY